MGNYGWVLVIALPVAVIVGIVVRYVRSRHDRQARREGMRIALSAADEAQGIFLARPEQSPLHSEFTNRAAPELVLDEHESSPENRLREREPNDRSGRA